MESEKPEGAKVPCSALLGELRSDVETQLRDRAARKWSTDAVRGHSLFLRAADEIAGLRRLLAEAAPVVESEAVMLDAMARHMAGGFPAQDVAVADAGADKLWNLNERIKAALLRPNVNSPAKSAD